MYKPDWKLKVPDRHHPDWYSFSEGVSTNYYEARSLEETRAWMWARWFRTDHDKAENGDVLTLVRKARLMVLEPNEEIESDAWVFTIRKVEP